MRRKKLFNYIGYGILGAALGGAYFNQAKFGRIPKGKRKEKIQQSANYYNNSFNNIEFTPVIPEGVTPFQAMKELLKGDEYQKPEVEIPVVKTDLKKLSEQEDDYYIWFGHSSYLLQINGIKYLLDPVFSGSVSPMPFSGKAFKGADYYKSNMLPDKIDYLIISHDHYDHLDYKTVTSIKDKVENVIVPLGVGEHFEYWGYDKDKLIELDWYEEKELSNDVKITAVPSRHTSGRLIKMAQSLWSAFVLEIAGRKIFLGGDSSYGNHFKDINQKFGDFDLVILENGQYNEMWKYSHLFPKETLQVAKKLGAKYVIPVHNSKFTLAPHNWNEPLKELLKYNEEFNLSILTPKIGEVVDLKNLDKKYERWFEDIN